MGKDDSMGTIALVAVAVAAYSWGKGSKPTPTPTPTPGGETADLILRPTAQGFYNELQGVFGGDAAGATEKWQLLARPQIDPATTFSWVQFWNNVYFWDTYKMQPHGALAGAIEKVTLWGWCGKTNELDESFGKFRIRLGTIDLDSPEIVLPWGWALFSAEFPTKPGGGDWTWADVDAMEAGFGTMGVGYKPGNIAQLYAVVTYYVEG